MYITRVRLKNIRCFENIDLKFDLNGPKLPWTLILGDNATGKSALLRAIAIGLCDEPSAAGLIKESDEGYIKRGKDSGWIRIWVKPSPRSKREYRITTTLKKIKTRGGGYEEVKKPKRIAAYVPWTKIFVCGYGAGRAVAGTGDVVGYSAINAVYSLFNFDEGLQNPELMLRRIRNTTVQKNVIEFLGDFLIGPRRSERVELTDSGISFDGPWGKKMPMRDVADGYKTSFMWIADLIGWGLSNQPKIINVRDIKGIVLIDEIEQHLHPSWQAVIIKDLRKSFPHIQFLATTHSPVSVASFGAPLNSHENDKIVLLERRNGNIMASEQKPNLGWRIDQILASREFMYTDLRSDESRNLIREASVLSANKSRTKTEEHKFIKLKELIRINLLGEPTSEIEREIKTESYDKIVKQISFYETKLEIIK